MLFLKQFYAMTSRNTRSISTRTTISRIEKEMSGSAIFRRSKCFGILLNKPRYLSLSKLQKENVIFNPLIDGNLVVSELLACRNVKLSINIGTEMATLSSTCEK